MTSADEEAARAAVRQLKKTKKKKKNEQKTTHTHTPDYWYGRPKQSHMRQQGTNNVEGPERAVAGLSEIGLVHAADTALVGA
jgi:hypothetical protein